MAFMTRMKCMTRMMSIASMKMHKKMNRTVYMVLATVGMSRLVNSPFDLPNWARAV